MTDTLPQLTHDQAAAIAEQTLRGFSSLPSLIEDIAGVIALNTEILGNDNAQRQREIAQRLELARLTQDAALYAEFTARQSAFLAQTSRRAEEKSGVSLSPLDLLCGVLNGVQQAGLDLSVCGSREDVQHIIEHLLNAGINATR